jgi:hypothetical protein
MGKLPRMGKPPYLKAHHLQQNDLLQIVEEPYIRDADESMFGRARGYAVVRLERTGEFYTWGLNGTTWDKLLDAFGEDGMLWKGKLVKVKLETQTIRGEEKQIIFGVPYQEPQKTLSN